MYKKRCMKQKPETQKQTIFNQSCIYVYLDFFYLILSKKKRESVRLCAKMLLLEIMSVTIRKVLCYYVTISIVTVRLVDLFWPACLCTSLGDQ